MCKRLTRLMGVLGRELPDASDASPTETLGKKDSVTYRLYDRLASIRIDLCSKIRADNPTLWQ
jgi:hypothetical protein